MLLLRISSDDLIACDMYLTLNNAFYEAYVVRGWCWSVFMVS
jgi:hypothetical protein